MQIAQQRTNRDYPHPGFVIADSWLKGWVSFHLHARIDSRREEETSDFCWLFQRQKQRRGTTFDWLEIGPPLDVVPQSYRIEERPVYQEDAMLINIIEPMNQLQGMSLWLAALKRLCPLDECPCVPANRYPVQGAALVSFLRSRFNFVNKTLSRVVDGEAMGLAWYLIFPKNQLPHEMIERRTDIVKTVTGNQCRMQREGRKRVNIDNVPSILIPTLGEYGFGFLAYEHPDFLLKSVQEFFGPPEFGSGASKISNSHE